jgi:hypothetical protein
MKGSIAHLYLYLVKLSMQHSGPGCADMMHDTQLIFQNNSLGNIYLTKQNNQVMFINYEGMEHVEVLHLIAHYRLLLSHYNMIAPDLFSPDLFFVVFSTMWIHLILG